MFIYLPRLFLLILLGVIYFLFLPLASVVQAAWQEVTSARNEHSRTYQDTTNPNKYSWDGTLAPLHYESTLGSGNYNTQIDMTPVRVNNAQLDGWRVTQAGWHYALGQPGDKTTDGWVGFGGRQGQNWFKFRLARAGYLHWPTRAWQDVGGAPSYNRANLSTQTNNLTLGPNNDQIPVENVATWSNLWTTPSGGSFSVSWRANGERLKEEITLNQAGRNWIAANRPPTTPLTETYFGFVFQLDWSDIPKVIRAGIQQNLEGDFADDNENIQLKDSLDRLLAFMPLDNVKVPNSNPELVETQPLRKRFWKDADGNYYLLVGIRTDTLNSMSAGDLVFDPTIDAQVGASAQDADGRDGDNYFSTTDTTITIGGQHSSLGDHVSGYKWTGITMPTSSTITAASIIFTERYTVEIANTSMLMKGEKVASPADFSTKSDFDGRTRTTASVVWNLPNMTADIEYTSPDISTIIQELVDTYNYSSGAPISILTDNNGSAPGTYRFIWCYDGSTTKAPKLHIEYTSNQNPSAPTSLGPASLVDGSWGSDNTPTPTFTLSDPDGADTVKFQIQIDDTSDFSSAVVDYTSALAAQGATSFTVGQAAGSGSYTTGSAGQTLSDGSYYWRVKAIDNSAAASAYSTANSGAIAFKVDATAPTVPGTPSTTTPTSDNTPTWTWTASSDSGSGLATTPYTMQWSTDSGFASGVSSTTSTTNSFTHSTALADGTWYFRVKATDAVSNESSYSSNGSVVVDTTAPSISVTALSPDPTTDTTPTIAGTATDATTALTAIQYQVDSTSGSWTTCSADDGTIDETSEAFTCTTSTLTDGSHTIYIRATDSTTNTTALADYGTDTFTIDSTGPTVSLTAISPDPGTDTTPTISGTATDTTGTISTVQFQVDSTSGTWTACTASDGTFNSASEAFSCTTSTLTDGSHTIYVRATDNSSNVSSNASDAFTVDTTAPVSFDLDSPGGDSYTNNERPTFRWKAASTPDATSGLSKYKLEIDNGDSGDFSIDDIPTSRTTDYEANKYLLHYENFSDSDNTNNYISLYTKSSSEWGTGENDGKLKEGKRRWKVKAVDNAGNEREESRTLFVDKTGPSVEVENQNYTTNDTTPTVSGKITDSLAGDKTDNKVASGPKEVEIKFEKKNNLGVYNLHSLVTINLETTYWTSDGSKITDNSKNTGNKYATFSYAPTKSLPLGTYKVTVSGKDKAGNTGTVSFSLIIGTLAEVVTPEEEKIIERIIEEEIPGVTPETKEKIKEELELTKPTPPEELRVTEGVIPTLISTTQTIYWGIIDTAKTMVKQVAALWQTFTRFAQETKKKPSTVLGLEKKEEVLPPITLPPQMLTPEALPDVVRETLLTTTQFINSGGSERMTIAKQKDSRIGQKKQVIPEELQLKIASLYTILFDKEPTRITEVKIIELGKDYAVILWKTNHYTNNNKVNYGEDLSYSNFTFGADKKKEHVVKITGLKPGTRYFFEVMSQNKNYVYDANRELTTLGE